MNIRELLLKELRVASVTKGISASSLPFSVTMNTTRLPQTKHRQFASSLLLSLGLALLALLGRSLLLLHQSLHLLNLLNQESANNPTQQMVRPRAGSYLSLTSE